MTFDYSHRSVLHKVLEELTFDYTVGMDILCKTIVENTIPQTMYKSYDDGQKRALYNNAQNKVSNVISKLCDTQKNDSTIDTSKYIKQGTIFNCPKVYDSVLLESQVELYNKFANIIHYPERSSNRITFACKNELLIDKTNSDGFVYFNDTLIPQRKIGISFIEYILFMTLCFCVNGRSLGVLNKPIDLNNRKHRARAKDFLDKFEKIIESNFLYPSYIDTFFYCYSNIAAVDYCFWSKKYIEDLYWGFPEEYKDEEDKYSAYKAILEKEKEIKKDDEGNLCYGKLMFMNSNFDNLPDVSSQNIFESISDLEIIIPLTHMLLRNIYDKSRNISANILLSDSITSSIESILNNLARSIFIGASDQMIALYIKKQFLPTIYHARVINTFITEAVNLTKNLSTSFAEYKIR